MSVQYALYSLRFLCHSYGIRMYSYDTRMSVTRSTCMSSVRLSSSVTLMHSYVIRMSFVCTRMNAYVTRMPLICICMLLVCNSYVRACHPYVTRIYSCVIRTSVVLRSYALVCLLYVTGMWF